MDYYLRGKQPYCPLFQVLYKQSDKRHVLIFEGSGVSLAPY